MCWLLVSLIKLLFGPGLIRLGTFCLHFATFNASKLFSAADQVCRGEGAEKKSVEETVEETAEESVVELRA